MSFTALFMSRKMSPSFASCVASTSSIVPDAALLVWLAGIPERIGYRRDGRGMLLTRAIEERQKLASQDAELRKATGETRANIKALEKKYPALDRVSVSLSVGVPEKVALEQLERFAKEVMPAFKGNKASGRR